MDLRVENIFHEEMKNDTSFKEKPSVLEMIFGEKKYSQAEVREIWERGIRLGIETGLQKASLEGQKIEMYNNANPRQKEFLDEFYKLAEKYSCSISYHPEFGMIPLDRKPEYEQ